MCLYRYLCDKMLTNQKKKKKQKGKKEKQLDSLGVVKLKHFTREQRILIVEQYFQKKYDENLTATVRKLPIKYGGEYTFCFVNCAGNN